MIGFRLWQIAGWTMLHYLWLGAALGAVALFPAANLAVDHSERPLYGCLGQSAAVERRARGDCRCSDAERCPRGEMSNHWLWVMRRPHPRRPPFEARSSADNRKRGEPSRNASLAADTIDVSRPAEAPQTPPKRAAFWRCSIWPRRGCPGSGSAVAPLSFRADDCRIASGRNVCGAEPSVGKTPGLAKNVPAVGGFV